MASLCPDVSFPLMGSSTIALGDRLRLRLLSLGGTLIDEKWGGHDFAAPQWRVYLNLDDGAWAEVGGRRVNLVAGRLYVIPAWLHWLGGCRGRVRHINALFDLPTAGREVVTEIATDVFDLGGQSAAVPAAWLALGVELAGSATVDARQQARGYALTYAAIEAVCAQLGPRASRLLAPAGADGLGPLLAVIEQHLADALPVAAVAGMARCSVAELHRRFLAGVGASPARWVRNRRLVLAADLLRTSDLPIGEIATRTGFSDRVRFSKVFAQHMGLGPAAWRRKERAR